MIISRGLISAEALVIVRAIYINTYNLAVLLLPFLTVLLKPESLEELKNKFKNISAYSFTTYNNELVVSFDGFEDQKDILEFADFVFAKIKMRYWHSTNVPTFH